MKPLTVSRIIAASPERVFKAWTDPEQLVRWWGPRGVTCPFATIDARVGGSFRIDNLLPDGTTVSISGTFLEWVRPDRLVYTWWVQPSATPREPGTQQHEERVTVHFDRHPEGTHVVVLHERIVDEPTRNSHRTGWEGCLQGLCELLNSGSHERARGTRDMDGS